MAHGADFERFPCAEHVDRKSKKEETEGPDCACGRHCNPGAVLVVVDQAVMDERGSAALRKQRLFFIKTKNWLLFISIIREYKEESFLVCGKQLFFKQEVMAVI